MKIVSKAYQHNKQILYKVEYEDGEEYYQSYSKMVKEDPNLIAEFELAQTPAVECRECLAKRYSKFAYRCSCCNACKHCNDGLMVRQVLELQTDEKGDQFVLCLTKNNQKFALKRLEIAEAKRIALPQLLDFLLARQK